MYTRVVGHNVIILLVGVFPEKQVSKFTSHWEPLMIKDLNIACCNQGQAKPSAFKQTLKARLQKYSKLCLKRNKKNL